MVSPFGKEEDIESLKRRFYVLEGDRKAYYESTQARLKQQKAKIERFKSENKELKDALLMLQRERGEKLNPTQSLEEEVRKCDDSVAHLRGTVDMEKHRTQRTRGELDTLEAEMKRLELEAADPRNTDTGVGRRLRALEDALDKAAIRHNEARSIQKTYTQIAECLRSERMSFEAQLVELDNATGLASNEVDELTALHEHAVRNVNELRLQLASVVETIERERLERAVTLDQQRRDVDQLLELEGANKEREAIRHNASLMRAAHTHEEAPAPTTEADASPDAFKVAMSRIAEATGVHSADEIIKKLETRGQTREDLEKLAEETQANIAVLTSECEAVRHALTDARFTGESGAPSMRRTIESVESRIAAAKTRIEQTKDRASTMGGLTMDAAAGVEHLAGMLKDVILPEPDEDEPTPRSAIRTVAAKIVLLYDFLNSYRDSGADSASDEDAKDDDEEEAAAYGSDFSAASVSSEDEDNQPRSVE